MFLTDNRKESRTVYMVVKIACRITPVIMLFKSYSLM